MNKTIICILCAGMLAVGCKKSAGGKQPPKPKEDVIQLQKIDLGNVYHKFEYNTDGLLTRVESFIRPAFGAAGLDTMYQYTRFEYNKDKLTNAYYYRQVDLSSLVYYTAGSFKYIYDKSDKLTCVAGVATDPGEQFLWRDTTYYTFDNQNRVTGSRYSNHARQFFKELKWNYDMNGNVQRPDSTQPVTNRTTKYYFWEFRYDNNINPWRFKNLGLAMYTVFEEDVFGIETKFSYNNPIYKNSTEIEERVNSRGEVVESTGENFIVEQVFKLDKNNSPESSDVSSFGENLVNRQVVGRAGGYSHTYKMISEKKTI